MNILCVVGALHREFGGPPMAVTGVASSLAKLGHQVKVLVCGQSVQDSMTNSVFFEKLFKSGAEVEVFRRRRESKYGTVVRFHELKSLWSDISKADFVILHQVFELQYFAIFPALIILKKPFAVMPHGTLTNYQRKQHRFRKFLFAPATYSFLKSADSIFVATEQEKNQLPRFLRRKGNIVGLGIDTQDRQTRNPLNSSPSFNLLFMGRIAQKKRLDIALQAFALASKKSELKMKFIVCGSGEERDMALLKELVVALNIEAEVEFRGWVDFNEKQQAFQESDCFILTSEDENFAIAAAEALAHGVPCILSSNVALSSLVTKHGAGIVFKELVPLEIEKAIIEISSLGREIFRNSSLRAASEISWELIARQWEVSIERLLKN
jgi:glycosyltransferase involved in cell wall biosynthesis